jgi:hypothetical protein
MDGGEAGAVNRGRDLREEIRRIRYGPVDIAMEMLYGWILRPRMISVWLWTLRALLVVRARIPMFWLRGSRFHFM